MKKVAYIRREASFGAAFAVARAEGCDEFEWRGDRYHTALADPRERVTSPTYPVLRIEEEPDKGFNVTEARIAVAKARAALGIPSQWMHRKRGSVYWVQAVGIREEDGAALVVYRDSEKGTCWVRPADEFLDGRFVKIGEDEEILDA